ncbi:MAG: hypothetical protein JW843_00735 [Candidatus Aminicenantes bacterium]|nr:hypothetical protein [Candidatus Aminicenantes bacterium]
MPQRPVSGGFSRPQGRILFFPRVETTVVDLERRESRRRGNEEFELFRPKRKVEDEAERFVRVMDAGIMEGDDIGPLGLLHLGRLDIVLVIHAVFAETLGQP